MTVVEIASNHSTLFHLICAYAEENGADKKPTPFRFSISQLSSD
jgi:hypothetical protein